MLAWLRTWWDTASTLPCKGCGQLVPVTEYRETGRTRKTSWWAGPVVELACPHCGETFWIKR